MSEIPSGYKYIFKEPYESFDSKSGSITRKNINDKCEIVRINSKEDCERFIAALGYYKISNGPFQTATLIEYTSTPLDYEGMRDVDPEDIIIKVQLDNGEILEQGWNDVFKCFSFYFVAGTNPEKPQDTNVTLSFLNGSCLDRKISKTFGSGQKIGDIKNFIKEQNCLSEGYSTITLVWDEKSEKLTNDDQSIYTLGKTANITVKFGKAKPQGGGRKSCRRKTNKNKRIRRKSVKRLHRRK